MAKNGLCVNDIAAASLARLERQIASSGGRIVIAVHPFYDAADPEYEKKIKNVLVKTKWPVVILEEHNQIEALKKKLKALKSPQHLILPTIQGFSYLRMDYDPKKRMEIVDSDYSALARMLEARGAKRIFIAGMKTQQLYSSQSVFQHEKRQLAPHKKEPSKWTVARECVSLLYRGLIISKKFEHIKLLAPAVFPHPEAPKKMRQRRIVKRKVRKK